MIKEQGVVTRIDASHAFVKTTRPHACEACSSKQSCSDSGRFKDITVTVKNTLNVKRGDHVVLGIETRPMIFLSFLLYVFPIICLIIGAVIGNAMAPSFHQDPSLTSIIVGFVFLGLAFGLIRLKHSTLSQKKSFKPFLIRKSPKPQFTCDLT